MICPICRNLRTDENRYWEWAWFFPQHKARFREMASNLRAIRQDHATECRECSPKRDIIA